ncbi:S1/P1 nuclease [Bosea sp. RAF48]|uniref:S1/P1 nuclease n=1 Tax=Bosea sp. RAF48 TaxID=3237480 RepID=UPI003F915C82
MRAIQVLAFGFVTLAGLFSFGGEARAWGKFGHLTICDLAYRNFTDKAREELKKLFQVGRGGIGVKGRGKMDDRHYTSYNVGCLEEDELPRKHPDDHFINVSRDTKSITNSACPAAADCILSGIGRDFDTLRDTARPNEERVFALMALGHWIGDIHQPLHVSFSDDRGGNGIDAKITGGKCGRSTYRVKNLHGIWDNCLLEAGLFERVRNRADFRKSWSKNTITYRAVDTLQATTSLAEEKELVGGDPVKWANESFEITVMPEVRYCVIVAGVCKYSSGSVQLGNGVPKRSEQFDQAYLAMFSKTAQNRVKAAGFRLAHLVNLALDPAYTGPVQDNLQP